MCPKNINDIRIYTDKNYENIYVECRFTVVLNTSHKFVFFCIAYNRIYKRHHRYN